MVLQSSPSVLLAASRDLHALLAAISSEIPTLAVVTAERQRLTLTAWIARARAAEALLGGHWARQQLVRVVEQAFKLSRVWWPGRVAALDPCTTPATALPGPPLQSWRDVAAAALAALDRAETWADDLARIPPPHDADDLFRATSDLLTAETIP